MARISDTELERLKSDISIESLAQARGIVLRKHGEELIGLCPFHDDHSPSLVINAEKNLWHCLGACQAGGSVIDWVMKAEGVSFRHAVELLRKDALSLAASSPRPVVKRAKTPKLAPVVETDTDKQRQLHQVIDYYHQTLKQSPEALAYLEKRGLNSSEMIEKFRLGFSDRTLGYHMPFTCKSEGAAIRGKLQEIGILRETGHEHFRGSLVIPVIKEAGEITEVYGRKIGEKFRPGTPLHLYLPGPHQGVWNEEALLANSEIILCESLIDALTFWCAGYRNVTAAYGIEGFTTDHLQAFLEYGIERVLIAYDRDAAGEKAASSLADKLMHEGMECFRIQFPKGMDANEYALQLQPAEKSLGLLIRKSVWLGKGAAPLISTGADSNGPVFKAAKEGKEKGADTPAAPVKPQPVSLLAAEEESSELEPVSPVPKSKPVNIKAEVKDGEVLIRLERQTLAHPGPGEKSLFQSAARQRHGLLRRRLLCRYSGSLLLPPARTLPQGSCRGAGARRGEPQKGSGQGALEAGGAAGTADQSNPAKEVRPR